MMWSPRVSGQRSVEVGWRRKARRSPRQEGPARPFLPFLFSRAARARELKLKAGQTAAATPHAAHTHSRGDSREQREERRERVNIIHTRQGNLTLLYEEILVKAVAGEGHKVLILLFGNERRENDRSQSARDRQSSTSPTITPARSPTDLSYS